LNPCTSGFQWKGALDGVAVEPERRETELALVRICVGMVWGNAGQGESVERLDVDGMTES
jgi:hypothetical protein